MKEKILSEMGEAIEEMKRVEHQIYVSLKYTRTVDVILNCLYRMVEAYEHLVEVLLIVAEKRGKEIKHVEGAMEKADYVSKLFNDDDIVVDNMELYILLRKILKAKDVVRENEYRRHVTLKTIIDNREEIVNIDIITNYFLFEKEFLKHIKEIVDNLLGIKSEKDF